MPTETMPTGPLGPHTGGRVGVGAMQLVPEQRLSPGKTVPREQAVAVLRRAVDLGVTHVDTAEFYGGGATNALIRQALAPYSDGLVLATKVGALHTGAGLMAAQKPQELRAQVEQNLRSLGVERLGLVNLRRVDSPPGIVAEGDQRVDLDDQLAELVALREAGKLDAIGLSAVDAEQLRRALPAGVACVQNRYNLLDRDQEPILRLCADHGLAFAPFFPLGSGTADAPSPTREPRVRQVADALGATPHQVCLAWLLQHDPHVLLISGTSDVGHLESNIAAASLRLDPEQVALLDTVA